jgi:hypothetical protein
MTTIASIRKRQGIAAPITESQRAEYERAKAKRRGDNVVNAMEILARNGLDWEVRNGSAHEGSLFKVRSGFIVIHYWPEIGRWIDKDGATRFGCRNLVRYLKGEVI